MATPVDLRILPHPEAVACEAASEIAARATQAVEANRTFALALSGGSTPLRLYRLLASEPWRRRLPWASIHLLWGDERAVPPDHPDSNYGTARRELIGRVQIPPENVHPIPAELGAPEAARRYEEELRRFFHPTPGSSGGPRHSPARSPSPPGETLPRFDLVLLGLGADGHTASLFPGSCALHQEKRWVVAPWVDRLGAHRVTLTLPVLNAAAAVLFLVTGVDKAAALARGMDGEGSVEETPARGVTPTNGELIWLVDRAAARPLDTP